MSRQVLGSAIVLLLCFTVTVAQAAQRGGAGGRSGGKPGGGRSPGGSWSEGKPGGHSGPQLHGGSHEGPGAGGAAAGRAGGESRNPLAAGGQGAAAAGAAKRQPSQSGAEGAAAGAAAARNKQPQATGAQGAAAAGAAANRNQPQASGAQGAAAGAAAANRNQPQATGAQGAAAGAAIANRNQPQVSGAEGAAAGAAVANRNQPAVSGAAGAAAVRNSFDHPDLYGQQWHADHPEAWTATNWAAGSTWTPAKWAAVAEHCSFANTPVLFNYGQNVTCLEGNVQIDGQTVCTAEEFSQQAADLAATGAAAEAPADDSWLPLGVFALVRNEQQHPQLILQFAVNPQGVLRGNYTDQVTENSQPIQGSVDKATQRMAWTVGSNSNAVMEAGLSNLIKGEAVALLHKSGKTERWLLVQLNQAAPAGGDAASPTTDQ